MLLWGPYVRVINAHDMLTCSIGGFEYTNFNILMHRFVFVSEGLETALRWMFLWMNDSSMSEIFIVTAFVSI